MWQAGSTFVLSQSPGFCNATGTSQNFLSQSPSPGIELMPNYRTKTSHRWPVQRRVIAFAAVVLCALGTQCFALAQFDDLPSDPSMPEVPDFAPKVNRGMDVFGEMRMPRRSWQTSGSKAMRQFRKLSSCRKSSHSPTAPDTSTGSGRQAFVVSNSLVFQRSGTL